MQARLLIMDEQSHISYLLNERQAEIDRLQKLIHQQEHLMKILAHDLQNSVANLRMAHALMEQQPDPRILTGMALSLDGIDTMMADYVAAFSLWDDRANKQTLIAVDETIQSIIDEYLPSATQKHITLHNSSKPGQVIADLTQLKQVIRNLVSNAIKYSPSNSTVQISSDIEADRVCIYVVDEGPGIPEHERHLLFTEFGKLSTRPTACENSTGLGLWIVKNLVEDMGGTVGEDNLPDGGAKFWVKLPRQVA